MVSTMCTAAANCECSAARSKPPRGGEGLHAGWYFKEGIGVQRAGAAVVAGVERGEEIHHLAAANLAHHDAVRPHAQRLAQQL